MRLDNKHMFVCDEFEKILLRFKTWAFYISTNELAARCSQSIWLLSETDFINKNLFESDKVLIPPTLINGFLSQLHTSVNHLMLHIMLKRQLRGSKNTYVQDAVLLDLSTRF